MKNLVSFGIKLILCGLVAVSGQMPAAAQDVSKSNESSFESQFWQYLVSNNYKNWAPPAGTDGQFFTGQQPHGPLQKIYLNRTAAANPKELPDESVIVLENYRSDQSLKSIAVMVRSIGTDADHRDWYMMLYGPDGTLLESSGRTAPAQPNLEEQLAVTLNEVTFASAASQSCVQCHCQAAGDDLVHFNAARPQGRERVAKESTQQSPR